MKVDVFFVLRRRFENVFQKGRLRMFQLLLDERRERTHLEIRCIMEQAVIEFRDGYRNEKNLGMNQ